MIYKRELNLTKTILKKTLLQVTDHGRIKNVYLTIGEISELDQTLIETYWREFSKDTPAEHARLHFRSSKAEVQCMACFSKYHPIDGKIHCPYCGSHGAKILVGEECNLESIELDHNEK